MTDVETALNCGENQPKQRDLKTKRAYLPLRIEGATVRSNHAARRRQPRACRSEESEPGIDDNNTAARSGGSRYRAPCRSRIRGLDLHRRRLSPHGRCCRVKTSSRRTWCGKTASVHRGALLGTAEREKHRQCPRDILRTAFAKRQRNQPATELLSCAAPVAAPSRGGNVWRMRRQDTCSQSIAIGRRTSSIVGDHARLGGGVATRAEARTRTLGRGGRFGSAADGHAVGDRRHRDRPAAPSASVSRMYKQSTRAAGIGCMISRLAPARGSPEPLAGAMQPMAIPPKERCPGVPCVAHGTIAGLAAHLSAVPLVRPCRQPRSRGGA